MSIRPGERNHSAFRVAELQRNPEQLARKFAEILAGWLTKDEQEMIVRQNAKEANPSICHSHDYCDPNQAMIDALESFGIELDCQSDAQIALTTDAWNLAKQNGFWFEPAKQEALGFKRSASTF